MRAKLAATAAWLAIIGGAAWGGAAFAAADQATNPPAARPAFRPYGGPITLDQAKRAAAGAEAEARRRGVNISIAVATPDGTIVYYEHMDGALYATDDLSKLKARNSARYGWPTSYFVTMQKNGQSFPDVFVGGGGMPLVVDGKTVGAIGVSGAADDPIAQAGVDALR